MNSLDLIFILLLILAFIVLRFHCFTDCYNRVHGLEDESEGKDAALKVAIDKVKSLEEAQLELEKEKVSQLESFKAL